MAIPTIRANALYSTKYTRISGIQWSPSRILFLSTETTRDADISTSNPKPGLQQDAGGGSAECAWHGRRYSGCILLHNFGRLSLHPRRLGRPNHPRQPILDRNAWVEVTVENGSKGPTSAGAGVYFQYQRTGCWCLHRDPIHSTSTRHHALFIPTLFCGSLSISVPFIHSIIPQSQSLLCSVLC